MSPEKLADLYEMMAETASDMAAESRKVANSFEVVGQEYDAYDLWRSIDQWARLAITYRSRAENARKRAQSVR